MKTPFEIVLGWLKRWGLAIVVIIVGLVIIDFASLPFAKWRYKKMQEGVLEKSSDLLNLSPKVPSLTDKEKLDIINEGQQHLFQIIGGLAFLLGIYATWKNLKTAERNLIATKKGLFTERFTKAIEQLGHDNKLIQLGGIYSLGKLAKERQNYHNDTFETLCAFLRDMSPYTSSENEESETPTTLIKAIISVIANRKHIDEEYPFLIDLSQTNLGNIDFKKQAFVYPQKAGDSDFYSTCLKASKFDQSYLKGVDLQKADLRKSSFLAANLREAKLGGANLREATLRKADLYKIDFKDADLESANLIGCINLDSESLTKAKSLYKTKLNKDHEQYIKQNYPGLLEKP